VSSTVEKEPSREKEMLAEKLDSFATLDIKVDNCLRYIAKMLA
jgi:hypothetical protein